MNRPDAPLILLFGHSGQLGWELRRTLATLGDIVTAGVDGAERYLDLTDAHALDVLVHELRPTLMVNATAYTAVDKAESDETLAYQINAEAVGRMGKLGAEMDIPVLHFSTDYVFSGKSKHPWKENDPPDPQSVYGKSKLAGEQALLGSRADSLILRTAWVYGARGSNFLLTMLRLFAEKKQLGVVDDQFGAPTWSRLLAEATAQLLAQCKTPEGGFTFGVHHGQVFHLTAAGEASWHEFAQAILDMSKEECVLDAISTEQYPTPAARPAYSVLDTGSLHEAFGVRLPHWRQGLALCMEELFDRQ
ncbi:MAG TPA: dTDP-4-dehydrorhamnose reductase [Chromatiaceae bacterium]|nr:dTDP-4-dehydrorhamnose reductase [Chromatiaceae bacterium]